MKATFDQLRAQQPQLFSAAAVAIAPRARQEMAALIAAIESVIALPAFQERVLAQAPAIARLPARARGAFQWWSPAGTTRWETLTPSKPWPPLGAAAWKTRAGWDTSTPHRVLALGLWGWR